MLVKGTVHHNVNMALFVQGSEAEESGIPKMTDLSLLNSCMRYLKPQRLQPENLEPAYFISLLLGRNLLPA